MFELKKIAAVLCALSSCTSFAGTMGPVCVPGDVTVPCPHPSWAFSGQALYVEPSYHGLSYVATTTAGDVQRFHNVNMQWNWGFKVEGAYYYQTGKDINLNWYHFSDSTNRTIDGSIFSNAINVYTGRAGINLRPKWDAINLEFGQQVDLGSIEKLRYYGGIQYSHIQDRSSLTALGSTDGTPLSALIARSLSYNGFGPRVGSDFSYYWAHGVSVYARGAAALLIGNQNFVHTLSPAGAPSSVSGVMTSLVPELEGKLGATYTYAMSQGDLSLDLGWMWVNYFNALQEGIDISTPITVSNFGLQGLYFGLKWKGNLA